MTKKILGLVLCISIFFLTVLFAAGFFSFSKTQELSERELVKSQLSLANIYANQKASELAIDSYDSALKIDKNNIAALLGYGKLSLQEGMIVPHYFQQVLEKDSNNKEANFYMGLISLDNPKEARRYLELAGAYELEKKNKILEMLNDWPEEFSSYLHKRLLIAQVDIAIGENKLAINLLQSIVKERADYRDAWVLLGQAYYNIDQNENALDCFESALELDGDNEIISGLIEKVKNIE